MNTNLTYTSKTKKKQKAHAATNKSNTAILLFSMNNNIILYNVLMVQHRQLPLLACSLLPFRCDCWPRVQNKRQVKEEAKSRGGGSEGWNLHVEKGVDGWGGEGGGGDTSEGDSDSRESSGGPWTTTDTLDWGISPSALSVPSEHWHRDKNSLAQYWFIFLWIIHVYCISLYTNTWVVCICCMWMMCYKCNHPCTYSECKLRLHASAYYYMKGFLLFTEWPTLEFGLVPTCTCLLLQEGFQPRKYGIVPTCTCLELQVRLQPITWRYQFATAHCPQKTVLKLLLHNLYYIGLWWCSALVSHSWKYDGQP